MGRGWRKVSGGDHVRHVNDILGLLIKEKFPCLVQFGGTIVSANTWAHYATIPDAPDRDDKVFADKAQRVKAKLWVSLSRITLLNTLH